MSTKFANRATAAGLLIVLLLGVVAGGTPANAKLFVGPAQADAERKPVDRPCKVGVLGSAGSVVELVMTCGSRSVVVSFSPISKQYCDPKMRCHFSLAPIAQRYMTAGY